MLFSTMKNYDGKKFVTDVVAGIIVAIIALPLSIALALASGVGPEQGIYTAIIAGFIISFLGGSRVQIAGPTAAFATIVAGIVAKNGMSGLALATILAGIILILMGLLRLGSLIRFIPYTITTGFTAGIAVTIFIGQIKDFLGLSYPAGTMTIETTDKIKATVKNIDTFNYQALIVGGVCLLILIVWPLITEKIPGSLIAVLVGIAMVKFFKMDVNTIGNLYKIKSDLPPFTAPSFSMSAIRNILPDAFTIAILAAIESLLSCVVADGMINSHHRSNMELIAQGAGNIGSALFGGIPATGAIAQGALVADELGLPYAYVRPKPKDHGMGNQVEGELKKGAKVIVVEDLISTGGSSLKAVEALRQYGVEVIGMVASFTYGFPVAEEAFKTANVRLITLSDYAAVLEQAAETGYIKADDIEVLKEWRKDPSKWGI